LPSSTAFLSYVPTAAVGAAFAVLILLWMLWRLHTAAGAKLDANKERISLVIICKNQAEYIEYGMRRLHSILSATGAGVQVLLVVCPSEDGTGELAARLSEHLPAVQVIRPEGEGADRIDRAVSSGHQLARHPLILCFIPRRGADWHQLLAVCSRLFAARESGRLQRAQ